MTTSTEPARDVLTQADAEARAVRIADAAYDLRLDLRRGSPTYHGEVTITFADTGSGDTFLDHRGKSIERLEVNGQAVEPHWNGYRLTLPGSALRPRNTVVIGYENEYDHTGDGFHQFVDPEDGQEYLYTNFEPYEAHRLFPSFDQPDIKASYRLTVTCPSEWEVVANAREQEPQPADEGRTTHVFEQTQRFSTYLFALVAGPYHVARDQHNGIPLGLYCRESLVKYLDTDELFTLTKQGLEFFPEFFAYAYPFGKYDQVFVPEFNPGAMENVACVTHNEMYIFRDPPTDTQRMRRAETLLHEMAHMWFGNLTTMKWWNDLWLNESFATYMSFLAMTHNTRFRDAWKNFNSDIKTWAYRQDQLVTTHPIAGQVADTDQTFLNFDGITYGKGASVLKQLVATIGLDGFRDGMRRYFQRHAFANATLSQFLDALQEGSGRDLHAWARLWLETPSLNTIGATWDSDGERLTSLNLTQSAPAEYPTLRPHYLEIGLAREHDGGIAVESIPADIAAAEADIAAARGRPKPSFVFPNYNDHDFSKVALDRESLDYVRGNLDRVTDPLFRQLLWSSLWDMVRDQQFKSTDFVALACDKVRGETDLELIESIIARCVSALGRYVPDSMRIPAFHDFCTVAWERLLAAPRGDAQIIWARGLIATAVTADDLALPIRLADGAETVPGLTIDQDMRWDIAAKATALGMEGAAARVALEQEHDPSDRGQRASLRCAVAPADPAVKEAAWTRFLGEGYGSLHLTAAAMSGFHWYAQRTLLEPYTARFFEEVTGVFENKDRESAVSWFNNLFPGYRVEQGVLDQAERLLAAVGAGQPVLTRQLKEANDDLQRALKCRAFAAA